MMLIIYSTLRMCELKYMGELYHCIIYITFEERHVRVTFNF